MVPKTEGGGVLATGGGIEYVDHSIPGCHAIIKGG